VDAGYSSSDTGYTTRAKQIFKSHRITWPNTFLPGGWNDAVRIFNVGGYGKVVLDGTGIVRGVNVHGAELEPLIKQILGVKS